MKLSRAGELSLLEILRKRFGRRFRGVLVGIGDDAAVVRSGKTLLLTTDMMVEGVHFDLSWTTPFQLGFKLVSINVSDIYAMGGVPHYVLLNFSAKKENSMKLFNQFFDGIEEALKTYGASLIGGDISSADRIMLSLTAVGTGARVVKRAGARIGDRIYVTGPLGDSACGLAMLKKIRRTIDFAKRNRKGLPVTWDCAAPLLRRHLMPVARSSARIARYATSMIDISDGLLIDLSRLCRESRVGARIRMSDIPVSKEMNEASACMGISVQDLALSGGEDYELLFTASPEAGVKAYCIGEITHSGVSVVDDNGRTIKVSSRGYQHFSHQG